MPVAFGAKLEILGLAGRGECGAQQLVLATNRRHRQRDYRDRYMPPDATAATTTSTLDLNCVFSRVWKRPFFSAASELRGVHWGCMVH